MRVLPNNLNSAKLDERSLAKLIWIKDVKKMFILIPPLWPAIPLILGVGALLLTLPNPYTLAVGGTMNTFVGLAALFAVAF